VKTSLQSPKKIVKLSLIVCFLLFLGFYRDFVFKSINALLKAWDFNMDYAMPSSLRFLENYQYDTLLNLKWLLTFVFSLLYLIIALITVHLLFKNKNYLRITIGTYLGIAIFSGIFMLIGHYFQTTTNKMYEFARYFMGMAQSPIILMVLIPAFKLSEKEITKSMSN